MCGQNAAVLKADSSSRQSKIYSHEANKRHTDSKTEHINNLGNLLLSNCNVDSSLIDDMRENIRSRDQEETRRWHADTPPTSTCTACDNLEHQSGPPFTSSSVAQSSSTTSNPLRTSTIVQVPKMNKMSLALQTFHQALFIDKIFQLPGVQI